MGIHDHKKWGIIQGGLGIEPNSLTPLHRSRAVLCSDSDSLVTFKFEVMFVPQVSGRLPEDNERFHGLLQTLLPGSGYFLCQGLPSEVASLTTCNTKTTRRWGLPFNRVDHQECALWLKVTRSPWSTSSQVQLQRCEKCTKLIKYVKRAEKRKKLVTPEQRAERLLPSSKCPLRYLSPADLKIRRRNIAKEKLTQRRKVNLPHLLTACIDHIYRYPFCSFNSSRVVMTHVSARADGLKRPCL